MPVSVNTIRVYPRKSETIDYSSLIFRLGINQPINFETSEETATIFKTLIAGGALKLLVDLTECPFIDSSGVGLLINSVKEIRKKNGEIVILKSPSNVDSVIKLTNIDRIINTYENEDDAVEYLSFLNSNHEG